MITEALLSFFKLLVTGIMDLIGTLIPAPPGWAITAATNASEVFAVARSFDHWIPIGLTFSVAAAVFATWLAMVAVGVVRVIASYLTFGGGAT